MKWIRHYVDVVPSKGVVRVMQQIYESNNKHGLFKKKKLVITKIAEIPISVDIPLEEIVVNVEHFDNTAFQSDDRFFTTQQTIKRYNPELIKIEAQKALVGYNTEPKQLN